MYLIPKFIWKKLNPQIIVSSGRGICSVCGKKLNGEICQVPKAKEYLCRKHAKQIQTLNSESELVDNEEQEQTLSERQHEPEFSGYCDKCNKKIGGLDLFKCKYCKHHFCTKHRIPEEHECPSKIRTVLEKKGRVVYK